MQVLAFINPQGLLVTLTVISTFITIAHNGLKLYRDWRNKKSN